MKGRTMIFLFSPLFDFETYRNEVFDTFQQWAGYETLSNISNSLVS
jgi:hypothetical protein